MRTPSQQPWREKLVGLVGKTVRFRLRGPRADHWQVGTLIEFTLVAAGVDRAKVKLPVGRVMSVEPGIWEVEPHDV